MPPSIEDLIRKSTNIASLPAVYMRLVEVMEDPYSSADDVGAVISEDTGLTARLLRLVNSAMYGFPSAIESVKQGLTVVGTQQIHDLALATSVVDMFKDVPQELVDMASFWRHSIGCGVCARALASELKAPNVERHFVAGLLHDIGKLVVFMSHPDGARAAIEQSVDDKTLLHEAENAVLGYDHAAVGQALMSSWNLPVSLHAPVSLHHRPARATRFQIEVAVVHLADVFAHSMLMGSSAERWVPTLNAFAWERLGIPENAIANVLADVDQQYEAAVRTILEDSE